MVSPSCSRPQAATEGKDPNGRHQTPQADSDSVSKRGAADAGGGISIGYSGSAGSTVPGLDLEFNFVDWNAETQALEPRQESNTLTIDQVLVDARRMKALLQNPSVQICRSSDCLHIGDSHLCPRAVDDGPGRGGSHDHLQTMVCLGSHAFAISPIETGPPTAVAADPGNPGSRGLVGGPNLGLTLLIPASLMTLALHNPSNLCYLHSATLLLAYIMRAHTQGGPFRGAGQLEGALARLMQCNDAGTLREHRLLDDVSLATYASGLAESALSARLCGAHHVLIRPS